MYIATKSFTGSVVIASRSLLVDSRTDFGLVVCKRHPFRRPQIVGVLNSRVHRFPLRPRASMGDGNAEVPSNFRYTQLWVSDDGESHVKECKMTGFKSQAYSALPQFVRDEFGGEPHKMVFTELAVGLAQDLHTCPEVQFVITLSGSWYVKTTDGTKHVFKPGDVLFQDNTDKTPAKKTRYA